MKVFLIRHAETVHNVGQAWAGSTDSPLTNHGILQIDRLARHFRSAGIHFTHVFSSDLQRAAITAEGICGQQPEHSRVVPVVTPLLQEQHFGSREGVGFRQQRRQQQQPPSLIHGANPGSGVTAAAETEESMRARINTFLSQYLFPALSSTTVVEEEEESRHTEGKEAIAIVAHGIILRVLWTCLVEGLSVTNVHYQCTPDAMVAAGAPKWSNTGYMELSIRRRVLIEAAAAATADTAIQPPLSYRWSISVLSIDNKTHLRDLRRTGGGIGSSQYDAKQRGIESFFSRR